MINRPLKMIKNIAAFFVTPITFKRFKKCKILSIYVIISIPASLYTFNVIERYDSLDSRNFYMKRNMKQMLDKKIYKVENKTDIYAQFTKISKQNECARYLPSNQVDNTVSNDLINNKEWNNCVNKYSLSQRVDGFISSNSNVLSSFYDPQTTFDKFSTISRNIIPSPVEYVTSPPVGQEIYTVLPVKLIFSSSFDKILSYMQKLSAQCSSCLISIDKLNSINNSKLYNVTLMVLINLDIINKSMKNTLSKQVSSGEFTGKSLSNFKNKLPHKLETI